MAQSSHGDAAILWSHIPYLFDSSNLGNQSPAWNCPTNPLPQGWGRPLPTTEQLPNLRKTRRNAVAGRLVRPGRLRDLWVGLRGKGAVRGGNAVPKSGEHKKAGAGLE